MKSGPPSCENVSAALLLNDKLQIYFRKEGCTGRDWATITKHFAGRLSVSTNSTAIVKPMMLCEYLLFAVIYVRHHYLCSALELMSWLSDIPYYP